MSWSVRMVWSVAEKENADKVFQKKQTCYFSCQCNGPVLLSALSDETNLFPGFFFCFLFFINVRPTILPLVYTIYIHIYIYILNICKYINIYILNKETCFQLSNIWECVNKANKQIIVIVENLFFI